MGEGKDLDMPVKLREDQRSQQYVVRPSIERGGTKAAYHGDFDEPPNVAYRFKEHEGCLQLNLRTHIGKLHCSD